MSRKRFKQLPMFASDPAPAPKRARLRPRMAAKAKKLSQYYTQPREAERIAKFALELVPEARTVLEPSAGQGALMSALLARRPDLEITAIELDAGNAASILGRFPNVLVAHANFLEWSSSRRYDLCVMNPPFENGSVAEHVGRALLIAHHVVCHCPLTTLAGQERREKLWTHCELLALAVCSTRPKYLGEDGGKTDMCTILVREELSPRDPSVSCPITLEMWP